MNLFPQRRDARQSTAGAAINRRELIDVVDLKKRDADRTFALGLCDDRSKLRTGKVDQKRGDDDKDQRGTNYLKFSFGDHYVRPFP